MEEILKEMETRGAWKIMAIYQKHVIQYKHCGIWRYNEPGHPAAKDHLVNRHSLSPVEATALIDKARQKAIIKEKTKLTSKIVIL